MSNLPKAYLRLDPNIDQHDDPGAMVVLLCEANRQIPRGRFSNLTRLRQILGSKRLGVAIERGDLVWLSGSTYYVDGWDEWQEGDITVGERMFRMRGRRRNAAVTETYPLPLLSPDPSLPPPLGVGVDESASALSLRAREGLSEEETEVFATFAKLGAAIREESTLGRRLLSLIERRGAAAVLEVGKMLGEKGEKLSDRQLVLGAENFLDKIPIAKEIRAEQIADEEAKRNTRILQDMERRRREWEHFTDGT